jgi:cyclic pyranopterin phosphate synthase
MLRDRFGRGIGCLRPDCNRLRVTTDDRLRSRLFGDETPGLRKVLRDEDGDAAVAGLFRKAVAGKPAGHGPCAPASRPRPMSRAGG